MSAALKLNQGSKNLSQKPPLGENRPTLRLVWKNPKLSADSDREKSEARLSLVSGQTLYTYVANNPVNWVDPLGLEILVCNRKVNGFPFVGNHAYAWDTTTNTAEGMRGSSGSGADSNEKGRAGGDSCNDVEGSKGKEKDIMDFMRENQNNGMWFPFVNDCHNAIQDAVENSGLTYPGAPGGRFGPPR